MNRGIQAARRMGIGLGVVLAGALASASTASLASAEQTLRLGVLYDLSGPFAAAGSVACQVGALSAIDLVNEHGGVLGKYKVVAVTGDSQSKADIAINEAARLFDSEKVDLLEGIYSSAHAVPLAGKLDAQGRFLWITTAVASSVLKDKHYKYVFRPTVHSDQYGEATPRFIHDEAKAKLGMDPKDVKFAIIYEDGPYGTGIATANEEWIAKLGMKLVLKEGYSAQTADLSSLVTKLKRAHPDVILHSGYNPDISLFLRQSKEQGLKFKALIGHGAGYSQIDRLQEAFGADVDYIFDADPIAAQLLDPKTLAKGVPDLTQEMIKRYRAKTGSTAELPPHASMGFNNTWILLNYVVPRAITKYGGWSPEALRKAALDIDIPAGGTIQGYGVKFAPPEDKMAGQNLRSYIPVMQFIGGKIYVSAPKGIQTRDPVLPLPPSSPYAE
jgi:branched-chain amino acid transport system substrate-binding protein